MEELFSEFAVFLDFSGVMTFIGQVLFTVALSFGLVLLITWTYRKTYRGLAWSQSFIHTMIIMGVVAGVVILVVGNNLARAFGLVGALSIVRFRSAIREPRDVAFIFFAMGAGLACGTGFFLVGLVFTILVCGIVLLLDRLGYGEVRNSAKVLKVLIPENLNYEGLFDDIFQEFLDSFNLVRVQTTNLGTMFELVYSIRGKKDYDEKALVDLIRSRNGNLRVTVLLGTHLSELGEKV